MSWFKAEVDDGLGTEVHVNSIHIVSFVDHNDTCWINMVGGKSFGLVITAEELMKRIECTNTEPS